MQRARLNPCHGHRVQILTFAVALLAVSLLPIAVGSAGIGRNAGSGTGNRKAHTRLSNRCAPIFLSGRVWQP